MLQYHINIVFQYNITVPFWGNSTLHQLLTLWGCVLASRVTWRKDAQYHWPSQCDDVTRCTQARDAYKHVISFFASRKPLVCVIINKAVWLELWSPVSCQKLVTFREEKILSLCGVIWWANNLRDVSTFYNSWRWTWVICFGAEQVRSALKGAGCTHCDTWIGKV